MIYLLSIIILIGIICLVRKIFLILGIDFEENHTFKGNIFDSCDESP